MKSRGKSRDGFAIGFDSATIAQRSIHRLSKMALWSGLGMLGFVALLMAWMFYVKNNASHLEEELAACRELIQHVQLGLDVESKVILSSNDARSAAADSTSQSDWISYLHSVTERSERLAETGPLSEFASEIVISSGALETWHREAMDWHSKHAQLESEATQAYTHLCESIKRFRVELEARQGENRLAAIVQMREAIEEARQSGTLSAAMSKALRANFSPQQNNSIVELQLNALLLIYEHDRGRLAGYGANQIRPALMRIRREVEGTSLESLVSEIEDSMFRHTAEGAGDDWKPKGLMPLQLELIQHLSTREQLVGASNRFAEHLEAKRKSFSSISQQLAETLEQQFLFALTCVGALIGVTTLICYRIFWATTRRVSRHIHDQVNQLDSTAAALQREKHVLIVTQQQLEAEFEKHKTMQVEREKLYSDLATASRQAGMAEIANGVLHNVGNILNSVNVSVQLLVSNLKSSRLRSVSRLADLLDSQKDCLKEFYTNDPRAEKLPEFIQSLAEVVEEESRTTAEELETLHKNVEHIKQIISTQQTYACRSTMNEPVNLASLVDDAIKVSESSFSRHEIELERRFASVPEVFTDKHKVMQILVNLMKNAKQAVKEAKRSDRRIRVTLEETDHETVEISISDNGVGILAESMPQMFRHGFTTKSGGHGFGLHSSALAADELNGKLTVQSEGANQGATFTLELPLTSHIDAQEKHELETAAT